MYKLFLLTGCSFLSLLLSVFLFLSVNGGCSVGAGNWSFCNMCFSLSAAHWISPQRTMKVLSWTAQNKMKHLLSRFGTWLRPGGAVSLYWALHLLNGLTSELHNCLPLWLLGVWQQDPWVVCCCALTISAQRRKLYKNWVMHDFLSQRAYIE